MINSFILKRTFWRSAQFLRLFAFFHFFFNQFFMIFCVSLQLSKPNLIGLKNGFWRISTKWKMIFTLSKTFFLVLVSVSVWKLSNGWMSSFKKHFNPAYASFFGIRVKPPLRFWNSLRKFRVAIYLGLPHKNS